MDITKAKERLTKPTKQVKRSELQQLADEIYDYAKSIGMNVPWGRIVGRIKARGLEWSRGHWIELKRTPELDNIVKVFLAKDKIYE